MSNKKPLHAKGLCLCKISDCQPGNDKALGCSEKPLKPFLFEKRNRETFNGLRLFCLKRPDQKEVFLVPLFSKFGSLKFALQTANPNL